MTGFRFCSAAFPASVAFAIVLLSGVAMAQPGGDRGTRDGDRGGFGGGDRGGFGGGGDRGGFGGGDRGGFGGGDRGGFGGGPPGFGRGGFAGPPGFGGGDRGGFGGGDRGGFGRPTMDANGDGRLDQEELNNMPQGFRDMLQSRGVELKPGMSVDDFRNSMRDTFSQMREQGENPFQRSEDGSRSSAKSLSPFKPRKREPMTVDLPEDYVVLDIDRDGQVALYEWIAARRDELDTFDLMDVNRDGVLTPFELVESQDAPSTDEPRVVTYERERLSIVGAGAPKKSSSSSGSSSKSDRKESKQERKADRSETEERARNYFGAMDRNRNGQIDMEEWDSSRRLRPMFEQAGVKIEVMSEQEFVKRLTKISEQSGR
ncbi:MAG: hypothetical protein R3C49_26220 [Planctomycetaceae bacterium]